ncbi:hypothetical protein R1flu_013475 [Riccia fluitans]|uniref:Uncharacterized protein n=1 Tax=Riccia fluitans TaxID=41844 RepID=A0ABD1YDC4_9MARC
MSPILIYGWFTDLLNGKDNGLSTYSMAVDNSAAQSRLLLSPSCFNITSLGAGFFYNKLAGTSSIAYRIFGWLHVVTSISRRNIWAAVGPLALPNREWERDVFKSSALDCLAFSCMF